MLRPELVSEVLYEWLEKGPRTTSQDVHADVPQLWGISGSGTDALSGSEHMLMFGGEILGLGEIDHKGVKKRMDFELIVRTSTSTYPTRKPC